MMQLTKNFNSNELECPCCKGLVYDQRFLDKIQIMRTIIGIPFIISPGGAYRCRIYNDSLPNSVKDSRHLHGSALDISSRGWTGSQKWQFANEAFKLCLSLGVYSSFFHVDTRPGYPVLFYGKN